MSKEATFDVGVDIRAAMRAINSAASKAPNEIWILDTPKNRDFIERVRKDKKFKLRLMRP